ncbi:3-dehydroquinate synthase [Marinitoga hydrogenitolerans DSM 16785]|uniref:Shikimate kinase n=1 Tax=Marinitoga hydrogenitolerans (strain DSM 16785 / JCM 12826 / AT1271) TaxID=1122195 RepID=A0A1M4ZU20_MARH1|nr:shikimate kinase [Marinitoga hydrogenitolerans]SHF21292.1 3-dehydroquinate synthase [Marinitoga hydrogenitolerans DSM 16785]
MPIYLIGMMGSGKTTIGKILSNVLNKKFIDLDVEIEKRERKKIKMIFSQNGEKYFRDIETKILKKTESEDAIISTGGGIILKKENREILKKHKTFFLYVPIEELIKRVNIENRPLLKDGKNILFKIWYERKELYNKFDKVDLTNLNEFESAAKILYKICEEKSEKIENDFQNAIIKITGLKELKSKENIFVSKTVNRIYGKIFTNPYVLNDGESIKNYDNVKKIYTYLIKNKISRKDTIYGVGGGTVTDLIGFVGSTFKRGLNIKFYPTTLLAQVDASIGGKNAVNFENIKNAIGTFKIPEEVIIDPLTVISQKEENYFEGIVEAFKIAIIDGNISLFLNNIDKIKRRELKTIIEILKYAVKVKLDIVSQDPYDNNIRKILNLGHTYGHAFESYTGISHGLSVGWGLLKEVELSEKLGNKSKDFNLIKDFIYNILPSEIINIHLDKNQIFKYIIQDKKIEKIEKIEIPIIKSIGNVDLEVTMLERLS